MTESILLQVNTLNKITGSPYQAVAFDVFKLRPSLHLKPQMNRALSE